MKIKKILISLLFAALLVFAYGKVEAVIRFETGTIKKKNPWDKEKVVIYITGTTDITESEYAEHINNKTQIYLNVTVNKEENIKYYKSTMREDSSNRLKFTNKTSFEIEGATQITAKIMVNNKKRGNVETFKCSDPPEIKDISFLDNKITIKAGVPNGVKKTSVKVGNSTSEDTNIAGAIPDKIEGGNYIRKYDYHTGESGDGFKLSRGDKVNIEVEDLIGFKASKEIIYNPPKIEIVGMKNKQLQFKVEKTEYDIESIKVYKTDKSYTKNEDDAVNISNVKKETETYTYNNKNQGVNKGEYYLIVAKDIYGATATYKYTAQESWANGGSNNNTDNNSGTSVEDTSAPTCTSVEFLKNDGTWLDTKKDGSIYYNKASNEDVTVKITYNKAVSIAANTIGWSQSTGNVITKTFSESKLEGVYVQPSSGGETCSLIIDVKIDKVAPVIKINGKEVTSINSKTIIQDRDGNIQTDYNLPIDSYEKEITIEVSDDQIDEKEIDKYVKLQKDENVDENVVEFDKDFNNKMKLSILGSYTIKAEDEAGNIAIYKFKLTKAREEIEIYSKIIKITQDGKAVITIEPNITRQKFENELIKEPDEDKTNKENIDEQSDEDKLQLSKQYEFNIKEKGGNKEQISNNLIKTGMKLEIGGVEYDIIVTGDIDGDGFIAETDFSLMNYILYAKGIDGGILSKQEWSLSLEGELFEDIDKYIREDANGDGKVDEVDIEAVKARFDVNEDGKLDEEDERLIKYALDVNGDGIFDKKDLEYFITNRNDESDDNLEEYVKQTEKKSNEETSNGQNEESNMDTSNKQEQSTKIEIIDLGK